MPSPRPLRPLDRPVIGPFNGRQVAIAATAIALLAFALVVMTTPLANPADTTPPQPGSTFYLLGAPTVGLQAGDAAPELIGTQGGRPLGLTDLDGKPITLAAVRGRPVWLNFWATWCPPCQEETPVLRDVYEEYKDRGLALIAVSVQETSIDDVRNYVATYGLHYTVGFDGTAAIFHTYRVFGLPTHFFIDGGGVIRKVVLGPVTMEQARSYVDALLTAPTR